MLSLLLLTFPFVNNYYQPVRRPTSSQQGGWIGTSLVLQYAEAVGTSYTRIKVYRIPGGGRRWGTLGIFGEDVPLGPGTLSQNPLS